MVGSPAVVLRGISQEAGGTPMEQSGLLETYMRRVSPACLPEQGLEEEEQVTNEQTGVTNLPVIQEVGDSKD